MYQYFFPEKNELKDNLTKLTKLRFDRETLLEQCKLIDNEIDETDINTASYLYLDWMEKLKLEVDSNIKDDAIELLVMDFYLKNKPKTLEFYNDIIDKFINSSNFERTVGKYELFHTYLDDLINEMYESKEPIVQGNKELLATLIKEISEESNSK